MNLLSRPAIAAVSTPTRPALVLDLTAQRELAKLNELRFRPTVGDAHWEESLVEETRLRVLESRFVEAERHAIESLAATAPVDVDGFIQWFEGLKATGPGQHDPLFPWLETTATAEQMKWFLAQEVAGEAGFEDLVALTQIKMPTQPKLELARNYWDEMGQGRESGMHGPMLACLADALELHGADALAEPLALGNLMAALASNRRYAYHSIGALGVIELTAPDRSKCVNLGLRRLGISGQKRQYFALHATLDVQHSLTWNKDVLRPIVQESPSAARAIAEGALMRLRAGERCFARYRREFGWTGTTPPAAPLVAH